MSHFSKGLQIQNGNSKTMILDESLHICDHNDNIFLRADRNFVPIAIVQRIGHLLIVTGCHSAKITIKPENQ